MALNPRISGRCRWTRRPGSMIHVAVLLRNKTYGWSFEFVTSILLPCCWRCHETAGENPFCPQLARQPPGVDGRLFLISDLHAPTSFEPAATHPECAFHPTREPPSFDTATERHRLNGANACCPQFHPSFRFRIGINPDIIRHPETRLFRGVYAVPCTALKGICWAGHQMPMQISFHRYLRWNLPSFMSAFPAKLQSSIFGSENAPGIVGSKNTTQPARPRSPNSLLWSLSFIQLA